MKHKRPRKESTKKLVTVGAVSVPVYKFKDRYAIIYREGGKKSKRKTLSFKLGEKAAAFAKARELCSDIARGRIKADKLTGDELLLAVSARDVLAKRGLSLDAAARDVDAALELTGGAGIMEMARFWQRHHQDALAASQSLPEIHGALIKSLEKQDLSPRWRQALKQDLKRFVDAFATQPIRDITADQIQFWLDGQTGNWRTFNNRLRLVRQLFNYARKRRLLLQGTETEAKKVDARKRPRGEHSRPGVLSAGELADVLAHVGDAWRPFVALGAFAGMRRAEIERLDWSDVRWDERLIHVRQEVAKSTRRKAGDERFIPMRDQLLVWLAPWRDRASGPVCTRKRFEDELARLRIKVIADDADPANQRTVVRVAWPKNALRHTYGSCRTSETKNMPQVANEMGNSVAEVRRDYLNPRTEREVAAWASLLPPGTNVEGVIPFRAAKTS